MLSSENNLNIDPNEQRRTLDKQGKCVYRHFQVLQSVLLKTKGFIFLESRGWGLGRDFTKLQLNIFKIPLIPY